MAANLSAMAFGIFSGAGMILTGCSGHAFYRSGGCNSQGFPFKPSEKWTTFATVRHRTTRTRYCVSRNSFLGFAFKLVQEAEKSWRRIRGAERIDELLGGTVFRDGVPVTKDETKQQKLAA